MSLFEVLDRYGAPTLRRLVGVIVLFLILDGLRRPVAWLALWLELLQLRLNRYATQRVSPSPGPIHHHYATAHGEQAPHV
jgi:hypothetical protein